MSSLQQKIPLIVIVGQTASGKTNLSIDIAKQYSGEITSTDSRQVYRHLDIGTAKITPEEMQGIPHHMIDIIDPHERYTVAQFKNEAQQKINEVWQRSHLPILVGGSGMYNDIVVYNTELPTIPPNEALRKKLEQKTTQELLKILEQKDPQRRETIDPDNKRRIIRALEILEAHGSIPKKTYGEQLYTPLWIGLRWDNDELRTRIKTRNKNRLQNGLIEEIQELHKNGLSWERMEELGLEYRYVSRYMRGEIETQDDLLKILNTKIWQFAKRQATWFNKNQDIHWFHPQQDRQKIMQDVKTFIKKELA